MSLFFNNAITNQTTTINLTNDGTNITYQFICSAIGSKPNVNLTIYDSNTLLPLSNSQNSIIFDSCSSINVCTKILQISFQLQGSAFINMTSLSCSANSLNSLIPLYETITRRVQVTSIGLYDYLFYLIKLADSQS